MNRDSFVEPEVESLEQWQEEQLAKELPIEPEERERDWSEDTQ